MVEGEEEVALVRRSQEAVHMAAEEVLINLREVLVVVQLSGTNHH